MSDITELEKKIYNWLMLNYCVPIKPEKIAKEFTKIAEKEYEEKESEYLEEIKGRDGIISKVIDKRDELQKENAELKQQYDNEREWKLIYSKENAELKKDLKNQEKLYLDLRRLDNKNLQEIEELKKRIVGMAKHIDELEHSIAIPITKEKIIKILDKNIAIHPYYKEHNMEYAHQNYLEQIASEILGDDNEKDT